jgi:GMP synthase (glutamine-hydrolysing)
MILIIDLNYAGSLGYEEFVRPLKEIVSSVTDCSVCHYSQGIQAHEYEGIILSGTTLKDTHYLENIDLFSWLLSCDVPVLGICAGMQVIGLRFNSLLEPCTEIGMVQVVPTHDNWLIQAPIFAFELHTYGMTPSQDFISFARSHLSIQGIKHRKKEIYGILFHPEVRNQQIIKEFIYRI